MIELDGSYAEGGGSMLRQALAMSIHTGRDFKLTKIRLGRKKPGLAAQHLASLRAAALICGATFHGDWEGSTDVYFKPGSLKGGTHEFNITTAGSATLLTQSLLLPAIFSGKKHVFKVRGGTDVSWSPPFDYFRSVFLPHMRRFADVQAALLRRGYYPQGKGEIKVSVGKGVGTLKPILLDRRGRLLQVRGVSHASSDFEVDRASERQAESAKLQFKDVPISISTEYSSAASSGSGLTLWAVYGDEEVDMTCPLILGADALGAFDKKPEQVGKEAAAEMIKLIGSGACCDVHLVDQLIPYMAIVGGKLCNVELSNHSLSNMYIAEKFLDAKFHYENRILSCDPMQQR